MSQMGENRSKIMERCGQDSFTLTNTKHKTIGTKTKGNLARKLHFGSRQVEEQCSKRKSLIKVNNRHSRCFSPSHDNQSYGKPRHIHAIKMDKKHPPTLDPNNSCMKRSSTDSDHRCASIRSMGTRPPFLSASSRTKKLPPLVRLPPRLNGNDSVSNKSLKTVLAMNKNKNYCNVKTVKNPSQHQEKNSSCRCQTVTEELRINRTIRKQTHVNELQHMPQSLEEAYGRLNQQNKWIRTLMEDNEALKLAVKDLKNHCTISNKSYNCIGESQMQLKEDNSIIEQSKLRDAGKYLISSSAEGSLLTASEKMDNVPLESASSKDSGFEMITDAEVAEARIYDSYVIQLRRELEWKDVYIMKLLEREQSDYQAFKSIERSFYGLLATNKMKENLMMGKYFDIGTNYGTDIDSNTASTNKMRSLTKILNEDDDSRN